jgi:hypothetical protein
MNIDTQRKQKEEEIYKNLRSAKWILYLGIIFTFISPFVLTLGARFHIFDFSNTGQIGDTIGGITAPIVNILGAVLVFYALRAQIEANKLIQDQFYEQKKEELENKNIQHISVLYSDFVKNIEDFTFDKEKNVGSFETRKTELVFYTGSLAIHYFLKDLEYYGVRNPHNNEEIMNNGKIRQFYSILKSLDILLDKISNSKIQNIDREFYKSLITQKFEYSLFQEIKTEIKITPESKPCEKCGRYHNRFPILIKDYIQEIKLKLEKTQ